MEGTGWSVGEGASKEVRGRGVGWGVGLECESGDEDGGEEKAYGAGCEVVCGGAEEWLGGNGRGDACGFVGEMISRTYG